MSLNIFYLVRNLIHKINFVAGKFIPERERTKAEAEAASVQALE